MLNILSKVKWTKFRNYSGARISGTVPYKLPDPSTLLERSVWLTAQTESGGKFGSVMSYDGSGMTAGLHQAIAVYPREIRESDGNPLDDQGELWALLCDIKKVAPLIVDPLEIALLDVGWKLSEGHLYFTDNRPVPGPIIRDEFTPIDGIVPRWGESWGSAKGWALLFHDVFASPATFVAQVEFGKRHFVKISKRRVPGHTETVERVLFGPAGLQDTPTDPKDPMDLTAAVFFSFCVNAPGQALRDFSMAWAAAGNSADYFPRSLMRRFGMSGFANWKERYKRTRKEAMRVWDKSLFSGRDATMVQF